VRRPHVSHCHAYRYYIYQYILLYIYICTRWLESVLFFPPFSFTPQSVNDCIIIILYYTGPVSNCFKGCINDQHVLIISDWFQTSFNFHNVIRAIVQVGRGSMDVLSTPIAFKSASSKFKQYCLQLNDLHCDWASAVKIESKVYVRKVYVYVNNDIFEIYKLKRVQTVIFYRYSCSRPMIIMINRTKNLGNSNNNCCWPRCWCLPHKCPPCGLPSHHHSSPWPST